MNELQSQEVFSEPSLYHLCTTKAYPNNCHKHHNLHPPFQVQPNTSTSLLTDFFILPTAIWAPVCFNSKVLKIVHKTIQVNAIQFWAEELDAICHGILQLLS